MARPPERYDPSAFEEQWMADWESNRIYAAPPIPAGKAKRFVMEMFPYPSGDLHMGHVENYSIADAMARFWRMRGFEVMHPMGYDAFGLPAENAALKRAVHPRDWTMSNIGQMRSSFKRLGYSYDWDREVISCEPDYYRWNQWIFLQMYERGLAYRKTSPVNWCPKDRTVLAREQLSTGVCWRCGSEPEVKDLTQWFLKITDYSDRLLDEMDDLNWSQSILSQQRNWIGRSRGAEVTFQIKRHDSDEVTEVPVFTTRPDTLWGATFFVIAAEHPLATKLVEGTELEASFKEFVDEVRRHSEVDRMAAKGLRKGMALPALAINPVNNEEIPVWAADYVLMSYGTGAVMAVPAHDQRDFEFARQHGLPVRVVIQPEGQELDGETLSEAHPGAGVMVESDRFNGTAVVPETQQGIDQVIDWLEEQAIGRGMINYRQHDWLVSRQRYWGTPIPIVYCDDCGEVAVPVEDLPVELPLESPVIDLSGPDGQLGELLTELSKPIEQTQSQLDAASEAISPLAGIAAFVQTACPKCGAEARRETDTLDTFFDSSWYFLRYCDPKNDEQPFSPDKVAAWGPVDQYVGGTEHAVMHLIYARFFTKFFEDLGLVGFSEPFPNLFNQGSISLGGEEMSSSRGNAIEAAEVVRRFGADSARTFILFCSPPGADYDFPLDGLEEIGRVAHSWLSRVWRILADPTDNAVPESLERRVHATIKAVTSDMEDFGFNTAIARMMELMNDFSRLKAPVPREAAEVFLKLLAPIAPFITEELWRRYGNTESIHLQPWPVYDESLATEQKITMVVQVNGKVRDRIEVAASIGRDEMQHLALSSQKVSVIANGRSPQKVITVPPRLVNLVFPSP